MLMTPFLRHAPVAPLPLSEPHPGKGVVILLALALVAALPWAAPVGMAGLSGAMALVLALPRPSRHPLLALTWTVLTLGLPLTLTLAHPGATLGGALAMGAAGVWAILAIRARRRCD